MRKNSKTADVVGILNKGIIDRFNLIGLKENQEILCGEDNKNHMREEHPIDFEKYFHMLEEILANPTYIAKHPKKDSIEYIKEIEKDGDKVLVAVRASGKGILFARTLFVMESSKVEAYKKKSALIPYDTIKNS